MQMRITTGGVLKGYKTNLMKSFIASNNARTKVLTGRNFNSYAENPAAATQAFQLRRSFWRADSQLTASQHTINQYEGAFQALDQVAEKVKNSIENSSNAAILRGLNDPTGEGREALGTELRQLAESIIQSMNTKYGDDFIFAGADGLNVPFSWAEDGKTLLYRGVPVDTQVPAEQYYNKDGTDIEYYTYEMKDKDGNTESFISMDEPTITDNNDGTVTVSVKDTDGNTHEVTLEQPKKDDATNTIENTVGKNIFTYNKITAHVNADGTFGTATKDEQAVRYRLTDELEIPPLPKPNPGDPLPPPGSPDPNPPAVPAGKWIMGATGGTEEVSIENETMERVLTATLNTLRTNNGGLDVEPLAGADANGLAITYLKNLQGKDADGNIIPINQTEIDSAKADLEKLDYLADEPVYVDLGLGFQEDENGNLIGSSAFNSALPGLTYIGYGVDEDGDPKNLASLSLRLGELLSSCKDGTWPDKATQDEANRLQLKLKEACDKFTNEYTQLTTRADFLKQNHNQLIDNADTINEQLDTIENMDLADAITSFSWAMYSYNAALKVGNSILSQSLMDYMS